MRFRSNEGRNVTVPAKKMIRVLITGAGGFVGKRLYSVIEDSGFEIVPVFRVCKPSLENGIDNAVVGKFINATTDWTSALIDVDVVIHLAAMTHVMHSGKANDLASFRELNVEGTRNLARQAAQLGVKRFVYLSSVKVNGEATSDSPFRFDQPPNPQDSYGLSKREAEDVLREIEEGAGLEVVIIRPPLVYGPGVKGNILALINVIRKGVPLPLGAINNCRDLVSIYNLCDLIRVCCLHPSAAGKTFLVSDGESISTTELIRYLANGLDQKIRLFSVPIWALKLVAGFFGQIGKVEKLTGDLQIDMSPTQQVLDWKPPLSVVESFRKMFTEG